MDGAGRNRPGAEPLRAFLVLWVRVTEVQLADHTNVPTDLEVGRLVATVRRRIVRLVRRHGIALEGAPEEAEATDRLALEEPALAAIAGASVRGRAATGPRAGHLVVRLGADATAPVVTSAGPRHAHHEGFDLHAAIAVRAGDRRRCERLCRYVLRPPLAQEARELLPDGRVRLRLRRPWRDGTRAIRFEPGELLEKLMVLVPRPRANLERDDLTRYAEAGADRVVALPWRRGREAEERLGTLADAVLR